MVSFPIARPTHFFTDPYFWKFQRKEKVFNLKELYYFEIIIIIIFLSDRPTDPTFWVEGDGKPNILLGWPKHKVKYFNKRFRLLSHFTTSG